MLCKFNWFKVCELFLFCEGYGVKCLINVNCMYIVLSLYLIFIDKFIFKKEKIYIGCVLGVFWVYFY